MRERGFTWNIALFGASFVLMLISLYMVFMWVPTEEVMGIVQRIFYFHVPLAWVAFIAFFVVFVSSILYLRSREDRWDRIAHSSAEIGVVFTTLNLVTGIIWAKPIWGVWWTWDARLTTVLVLWFIYISYLLVRSYAQASQAPRFAAVVGIIGFVDVPIVFGAIRWWRTVHPAPVIETGGLAPPMLYTLMVCLVAFTLLYVLLMRLRVSLMGAEAQVERLAQELRR
ncbi:MAG: cytochrome c biogenesis protein [Dehalococcoidia bacterium]